MKHSISVSQSIEIAVRHPQTASTLLAKTLAEFMRKQEWMNKKVIIQFFLLFIFNLIDGEVEREVDGELYKKIKDLPFHLGFRLMKRNPKKGLAVLVRIVMEELRDKQRLTYDEQIAFYNSLFENLFPDVNFANERTTMGSVGVSKTVAA